ncbi:DUF2790 domain-containing protein [Pseudomonas putida]|jgi:hypothetical protein|uniref:DUF2790 domain-containing protein n=1 Tax=Pseudomonas putida TaxID=303 RepID=UPI003D978AA2
MKYVLFAALSLASVFASAQESAQASSNQKGLDIARVISIKSAQDPEKVNGVINSQMVYLDSTGVTRTLDYTILGNGQQNG